MAHTPADLSFGPDPVLHFDGDDVTDTPKSTKSPLVETSALGYKRAMTTEVRVAPGWGNAISGYVRYLKAVDRSEGTIYLRSWQLRRFSQAFRGRNPWELTESDIETYMGTLDMARRTKRSMLTTIRQFYKFGMRKGLVKIDPTLYIESIPDVPGQPRPAADTDIRDALDRADDRTKLMIFLGAYCGLRRSEIARVHTSDVVRRPDGAFLKVMGKGQKPRTVPITPLMASMISDIEPGWVFPSWHRGMVNSDGKTCDEHLQPARVGELVRLALPTGVTTHMLRHRYASTFYAQSHDLRATQTVLGHRNVNTTQVYTAVADTSLRAGSDAAGMLYV